jgi:hypothetical protein
VRGVVRPMQQGDGEPLKTETSRTPLPIPEELALELPSAVARWGGVRPHRGYRRGSASTTCGTTWRPC